MEAVLLARHARLGGELIRIAVSRAAPVGSMQGWRPAMPVTQWIVGEAMIVAGIGSRKGVAAKDVLAAIDAALAAHGLATTAQIDRLATAALKRDEPAICCSRRARSACQLIIVDDEALRGRVAAHAQPFRAVACAWPARPRSPKPQRWPPPGQGAAAARRRASCSAPVTCAIAINGDAP